MELSLAIAQALPAPAVYVVAPIAGQHLYKGSTRNLRERLKDHLAGRESRTKNRRPLALVYCKYCDSFSDALQQERFLKSGKGRLWLKQFLAQPGQTVPPYADPPRAGNLLSYDFDGSQQQLIRAGGESIPYHSRFVCDAQPLLTGDSPPWEEITMRYRKLVLCWLPRELTTRIRRLAIIPICAVIAGLLSIAGPVKSEAQSAGGLAIVPLAGDFDGDRLADPAIYNTNGDWKIKSSRANYTTIPVPGFLGGGGTTALAADFDGDRLADPAVYSATQRLWAVRLSASHYPAPIFLPDFGGDDWQALAADFDGDRLADPALSNTNGTWKLKLSSTGYATTTNTGLLGLPGWTPIAADFDRDGKADPAIYQDLTGSWAMRLSSWNYALPISLPPGFLGSIDYVGLAADFDGDAYADPAAAQTSTGNWRIKLSGNNYALLPLDNFLGEDITAVTLQKVSNLYYRVDIDLQAASHYAVGRQYGLLIQNTVTNFEPEVDALVSAMLGLLQEADDSITLTTIINRARTILTNVPPAYQQEILGMQSVFSGTDDTLGNGKLSQNKVLIYQLVADIMRAYSCSASAAFGAATDTGNTIVGRNLEWFDATLDHLAALHTVALLHNGRRSIVIFGFLGQFQITSGFGASGLFAAILDSDTGRSYQLSGGTRSYPMDLRYALENATNIQEIADYFVGKSYAFDFNLCLADAERAAVLEVDIHTPFSGLRTATSPLKTGAAEPILPWNFTNAIAVVNWFTLPGTLDNSDCWTGNAPRWSAFIDLYAQYLGLGKITLDGMKLISGYPGPLGDGKAVHGAIWRYEDGEIAGFISPQSEIQVIIMDMQSLETWVSFQPPRQPALRSPNYIKVFCGNPFQ